MASESVIPIAPIFQPTAEEFQDPYKYIRSISKIGSEFGIVKIIPPPDFQPSLNLLEQGDTFSFKTRNQTIASLDGQTRLQLCYSQQLYKYHQSARKVYKVPEINGNYVNMYKLSKTIDQLQVDHPLGDTAIWKKAAKQLGYSESSHKQLKKIWKEWIFSFNQYVVAEPKVTTIPPKDQRMNQMKSIHYHHGIETTTKNDPITDDWNKIKVEFRKFCRNPKSDHKPKRSIKFLSFYNDLRPPYYGTWNKKSSCLSARAQFKKDTTMIDYGYDSEMEWQRINLASGVLKIIDVESESQDNSDADNNEEFILQPYSSQRKRRRNEQSEEFTDSTKYNGKNNKKSEKKNIDKKNDKKNYKKRKGSAEPPKLDPKEFFPLGNEQCLKCNESSSYSQKMVICDDCENAYHLHCVNPPLLESPDFSWICRHCILETGKFTGFIDNEEPRTLTQFKQKADLFKREYLENGGLLESDIEKEFWKLTESPFEDISVEYGADLHTSIHGSGFPTNIDNPYSSHPWNLNNFSVEKDSLFRMIKNDISGMMVPWMYIGMMFSSFCWHFEDHYTYSINYLHTGDSKTWYGIPSSSADNFEACMRKFNGKLFEDDPDLLLHLTTIISPQVLMQNNTFVCTAVQKPGEFVITFPRAHHAGFNNGFNIAEAVNFAPADWIPFGGDSIQFYALYKRPPVFSHEELLIRTILSRDFSPGMALYLKNAFSALISEEMLKRNTISIATISSQKILPPAEGNQCIYCKKFCLLSSLSCEICNQLACLGHSNYITCNCLQRNIVLNIYYSYDQLQELYQLILISGVLSEKWLYVASELCCKTATLSQLKEHLQEGLMLGMNSFQLSELQNYIEGIEKLQLKMRTVLKNVILKHSLQDLENVLNKSMKFKCIIPETKLIETSFITGKKLNDNFLERLDNVDDLSKLEEISNELEKFPFNLPVHDAVDAKITFLEKYEDLNFCVLDSAKVEKLIVESSQLNLLHFSNNLRVLLIEGKEIEDYCTQLLSEKNYHVKETILTQFETAVSSHIISKPVKEKLLAIISFLKKWISDFYYSFNESQARRLLDQCNEAPVAIIEMKLLRDELEKCKRWKDDFLKFLGSKSDFSLSARFFRQCFLLASEESTSGAHCICKLHNPDVCVQCVSCKYLYHLVCLKIDSPGAPFYCPCCKITEGYNPHNKPNIMKLVPLIEASMNLRILPDDAFELLNTSKELFAWLEKARQYIKYCKNSLELRNWLRILYGLPVITAEARELEIYLATQT